MKKVMLWWFATIVAWVFLAFVVWAAHIAMEQGVEGPGVVLPALFLGFAAFFITLVAWGETKRIIKKRRI